MKINLRNIAIHAAVWLIFLLYEWLFTQGVLQNPETSIFHLKIVLIRVAALLPAVYLTLYLLVPRLFFRGRKITFVFALIGIIILDTLLMKTMNYFLVLQGMEGFAPTYLKSISGLRGWLIFMGNISFNVSFALMIFFINKWVKEDQRRRELESAKKEAELQLLKAQVQPHFIFNTINNIYALSKKNSPDTTEMIFRLSGLLEYMLYDSTKEWISLKREVEYIENYLQIEKIRYGKRLDIAFNIYGAISDYVVPPLILLPFIENSFKHGLSRQTGNCWLRIELTSAEGWLHFKVENSKPDEDAPESKKGGLGIMNVRKRIDLLLGGEYELKQLNSADSYLVTLKLKMKIKEQEHDIQSRKMEMLSS